MMNAELFCINKFSLSKMWGLERTQAARDCGIDIVCVVGFLRVATGDGTGPKRRTVYDHPSSFTFCHVPPAHGAIVLCWRVGAFLALQYERRCAVGHYLGHPKLNSVVPEIRMEPRLDNGRYAMFVQIHGNRFRLGFGQARAETCPRVRFIGIVFEKQLASAFGASDLFLFVTFLTLRTYFHRTICVSCVSRGAGRSTPVRLRGRLFAV